MLNRPRIVAGRTTSNLSRHILAWSVVVASGAAFAGAPDGRPSATDVEGLRRAERTWAESLESGDARRLATIIDAQFIFIGPDGQVEKRQAYLAGYEALPTMGIAVERIDMDEVEYRVLGDIGIVTGRVLARVKVQGAPIEENVRFTRVYRRSSKGWQMVSGQGTRIAAATVPAKS